MNIEITSKKSKILHIQVKLDLENYVGWGGGFTKKVRPGIYCKGYIYMEGRLSQFFGLIEHKRDWHRLSPTVTELRRLCDGSRRN